MEERLQTNILTAEMHILAIFIVLKMKRMSWLREPEGWIMEGIETYKMKVKV